MLNKRSIQSNFSKRCGTDQDVVDEMHITLSSFLEIGSICAIAANDASFDTVFFVCILSDEVESEDIITDDFNHQISTKQIYYKCHYLEKSVECSTGYTYIENRKKVVFVYKEAIIYPFVNFGAKKDILFITMADYCDVLHFIEHSSMASLV